MPSQTIDLSIIVAIYKVEPYLRQCIESVLKQDYPSFELILVDDGSPDRCPSICEEYAAKDSRIKVIHQNNQGAVSARWNGVLASSGEFISLIDGDDWAEPNMYGHMMDLAKQNQADMVITGYQEDEEDGGKLGVQKKNAIASGVYTDDTLDLIHEKAIYNGRYYEPGIVPSLWNKIIRRDLFFDDYKPALSMIRMGDDAAVTYPMLARSKIVVVDNEFHPYHYRIRRGSLTRSFDEQYFDRAISLLAELKENLTLNCLMQSGVKYYGLFITQLGISSLFSRTRYNSISIREKYEVLKRYSDQYRAIGMTDGINWDGFSKESKMILQPFISNELWLMILRLYQNKVKGKIRNGIRKLKPLSRML